MIAKSQKLKSGWIGRSVLVISLLLFSKAHAVLELKPLIQQQCSVTDETLRSKLNEYYSYFFSNTVFDRSVYFLKTDVNPLNPSNDLPDFDSLALFNEYQAGSCVGIALKMISDLNQLGLHFQAIPSTIPEWVLQPNMPELGHVAPAMWCQDGYILLDPTYNIPVPIVVQKDDPLIVDLWSRGIWSFRLNEDGENILVTADSHDPINHPWTEEKKNSFEFHYLLHKATNPDEGIVKPWFLADRNVIFFKLTPPDRPLYILALNLNQFRLQLTKFAPDDGMTQILTIPFSEYYTSPSRFKTNLMQADEIEHIGIPREELFTRISVVLDRIK